MKSVNGENVSQFSIAYEQMHIVQFRSETRLIQYTLMVNY